MRFLSCSILAFMVFSSFQADKEKDNRIYWNVSHPLAWIDFTGKAPANSDFGAFTFCYTPYKLSSKKDSLYFSVECFFSKKDSWSQPDKRTEKLLKHEQGHFNLTEIYVRKFRKKLMEHNFRLSTVSKDVQSLFSSVDNELKAQHILYDKETDHSRQEEGQKKWDEKLHAMLKELAGYTRDNFAVHMQMN